MSVCVQIIGVGIQAAHPEGASAGIRHAIGLGQHIAREVVGQARSKPTTPVYLTNGSYVNISFIVGNGGGGASMDMNQPRPATYKIGMNKRDVDWRDVRRGEGGEGRPTD